jgi:2-polyprenyl-3-methyl-5-hydroxy-6-metoxy-1,4-benzoquinol methylase
VQIHPSLRRRLDAFRRQFPAAYWRGRNAVALGEWWWARHSAGQHSDAYDDAFWDFHGSSEWDGLAALILRYCPARSVVDVGCGQGLLLEGLRRANPSLNLSGYDGSPTALGRARSRGISVNQLDIVALSRSEAGALAGRLLSFDLALCLEVAEHIPSWHAGKLLTILTAAPRLVFSAAHPNQGGRHHVNEQPARYWIDHLAARGFKLASFDDALRAELQLLPVPPWYKDNMHVFDKIGRVV